MTKNDMVANIHKKEREEKQQNGREANNDQEVILKLLTSNINPKPCSLPGLRRKETVMATHTVDAF